MRRESAHCAALGGLPLREESWVVRTAGGRIVRNVDVDRCNTKSAATMSASCPVSLTPPPACGQRRSFAQGHHFSSIGLHGGG
jgi:hypothetical protein